ncbi:MAG TPA: nitrilase-related carbon-nitrogen hydrolase, partial [Kiritimatiellia bacterium]|nr:nitrilase-related carbon-nitrogen hydrolase [Kiritimatiellia bacterium]
MPATIAYPAADSNVQVIAEPPLVCLNGRMTKEIGMKVALLQMNPTVGALRENAARILKLAHAAAEAGAEIAVFPEMALCGYSPGDLVQRARFLDDVAATMAQLGAELPAGLLTIIGAPWRKDGQVINAALLWRDGQLLAVAGKTVLDDSVEFTESQGFVPASATLVHEVKGVRVG